MSWIGRFWNSPPALHWASSFLIQVSALAGLLVAAVWLAGQPVFALRSVQVLSTGPEIHHLSEDEVRQSVLSTSVGTALTRPLADLQSSLQAYPWVRQASVRRVWPNRLMIWIEEHQPVAIWTDGRLINQQGELFWVEQSPRAVGLVPGCRLPTLSGPVGSHDRVLARAQSLEQLLAAQGFSLAWLSLSDQFSWRAALHRGPELILGRDTLPRSYEDRAQAFTQHLAWLNQSLQPSASGAGRAAVHVTSADLRYANGFAFRAAPVATRQTREGDAESADQPNCLVFNREGRRTHDS
jgi:cell division protein FtsQ